MIPKIIHYCWFGKGEKPRYVAKCIASWRKYLPDYEIKEWNESNFDINLNQFTKGAYSAQKYAFVSDVARFWILYNHGGLYFDTDVEVIKGFDDIIANGAFMGVEMPSVNGSTPAVNPGLALGAEKGNFVIKAILDHYQTLSFNLDESRIANDSVVIHTSAVLSRQFCLCPSNDIQYLQGVTIYPVDYFNPFNDITGVLTKTSNTHSIHWFAKSWIDKPMIYFRITRLLHRFLGKNALNWLKK